jgi:hypothetical protein
MTTVKIVPSMRAEDGSLDVSRMRPGVGLPHVTYFWSRNRVEDNPEVASVCLLDLCTEVQRLRAELLVMKEKLEQITKTGP